MNTEVVKTFTSYEHAMLYLSALMPLCPERGCDFKVCVVYHGQKRITNVSKLQCMAWQVVN